MPLLVKTRKDLPWSLPKPDLGCQIKDAAPFTAFIENSKMCYQWLARYASANKDQVLITVDLYKFSQKCVQFV